MRNHSKGEQAGSEAFARLSPKVLFSSLMQANSHCLPANTLLAVKRLCSSRGSEFTSSIVSSACEPARPRQTEGEILFLCSLKDYGGKKTWKTLNKVCLWFFFMAPISSRGDGVCVIAQPSSFLHILAFFFLLLCNSCATEIRF